MERWNGKAASKRRLAYRCFAFTNVGETYDGRNNIDVTMASRRPARGVGTAGPGDWTEARFDRSQSQTRDQLPKTLSVTCPFSKSI
jgi:hypothetical protein